MSKKPSKRFNDSDVKRIENAVAVAESKTAAEIVPVVARDSGRYDRPEDIAGLWFGLIAMAIIWVFLQHESAAAAMWGSTLSWFELPILMGTAVVGFVLGALITTYSWTLRRLFTPQAQMRAEVEARAQEIFFDQRVHHTHNAGGMLIYLSLYERTASVLADRAVLDALGQATLDRLCAALIEGTKAGDMATALCETIEAAGDLLAVPFPRPEGDTNELSNSLILRD